MYDGGMKSFDEYVSWTTLGFEAPEHSTCTRCNKDFFSLSGTCLTCKFAKEALDSFIALCHTVQKVWWAGLDDSSKRFALMELK